MTQTDTLIHESRLHYISDDVPGIRRVKLKRGFSYKSSTGKIIKDKKELKRFGALGIPPAWESVWISPDPLGHIQAIGYDEKGRKQYRYHADWIAISQEKKFSNMIAFSKLLPLIREQIKTDMRKQSLDDRRVLATLVWLLEHTYIRIGNDEYAKDNKHYGLTTLRNKHVSFDKNEVTFEFIGKSGKPHLVGVNHPRIVKTIRQLEELPGYDLFQYIDIDGNRHRVTSQEVNDYLKEIAGENISAKDFRTWGGSVLATQTLHKLGPASSEQHTKKNITQAVKEVASHLRNTVAVCRKYYIHPAIPESYTEQTLFTLVERALKKESNQALSHYEQAFVNILKNYA